MVGKLWREDTKEKFQKKNPMQTLKGKYQRSRPMGKPQEKSLMQKFQRGNLNGTIRRETSNEKILQGQFQLDNSKKEFQQKDAKGNISKEQFHRETSNGKMSKRKVQWDNFNGTIPLGKSHGKVPMQTSNARIPMGQLQHENATKDTMRISQMERSNGTIRKGNLQRETFNGVQSG